MNQPAQSQPINTNFPPTPQPGSTVSSQPQPTIPSNQQAVESSQAESQIPPVTQTNPEIIHSQPQPNVGSDQQSAISSQSNVVQPTNEQLVQSTAHEDRVTATTTLYDAPLLSVIWRNLLAGMSRALGAVLLYSVFLVAFGWLFSQLIWPYLEPLLGSYTTLVETLTGGGGFFSNPLNQGTHNTTTIDPNQVNSLLESFGYTQDNLR